MVSTKPVIRICQLCGREFQQLQITLDRQALESSHCPQCGLAILETIIKGTPGIGELIYRLQRYLSSVKRRGTGKNRRLVPCTIGIKDLVDQWEKQGGICPYTGWQLRLPDLKNGRFSEPKDTPTPVSIA